MAMPPSSNEQFSSTRSWRQKFSHALRGLKRGVRGQSSFFVHFFVAAMVGAAGLALEATLVDWCLLVLCVAGVLVAEMFNSSLEWLAKAVTNQYDERLRDALDISSGAVLLAAAGAVVVGLIVFLHRLALVVGW